MPLELRENRDLLAIFTPLWFADLRWVAYKRCLVHRGQLFHVVYGASRTDTNSYISNPNQSVPQADSHLDTRIKTFLDLD